MASSYVYSFLRSLFFVWAASLAVASCSGSKAGDDGGPSALDSQIAEGGATGMGGVLASDGSIGTGGAWGGLDGSTPGVGGSVVPACGQPGLPCCDGNGCNGDGCCVSGICMAPGGSCVGLGGGVCTAGACGSCGGAGLPCCGTGVCTAAGTACSAGICTRCGDLGSPCCGGSGKCKGVNAICSNNVCQACGTSGMACCPGNLCASPGCCSAGVCVAETGACSAGEGTCQAGHCSGCGNSKQPCCSGSSCYDGLACRDGTCNPCGGAGQACCAATGGATSCGPGLACSGSGNAGTCARCGTPGDICCSGNACADGCCANGRCLAASACASTDAGQPPDVPITGSGGAPGTGGAGGVGSAGTTGETGGLGGAGGTGGVVVNPDAYADVKLITSCSGSRTEICDGSWFSVAGSSSSIQPANASGTFPMSAGGYLGSAAHVTGKVAASDYAQLGMNLCYGSDVFDASAYDGISFWAKAATSLPINVQLAQQNNDPHWTYCSATGSCYAYPHLPLTIGTTWSRYVVPFSALASVPLPDGGLVPVTPAAVKHFQFAFPTGSFDFWIDEVYLVRAK